MPSSSLPPLFTSFFPLSFQRRPSEPFIAGVAGVKGMIPSARTNDYAYDKEVNPERNIKKDIIRR